jgi:hypothetical protein
MNRNKLRMLANEVKFAAGEYANSDNLSFKALMEAHAFLLELSNMPAAGSFNYVPASKNCGVELWEHWDDDYPNTVKLYKLDLED